MMSHSQHHDHLDHEDQRDRHDHDGEGHAHHDEAGLADLLDLDAVVLGAYLEKVTEWAGRHAPDAPRTIVDVGAGTGTGGLAFARRFATAEVVAVDRSPLMLGRLQATARERGLADRLRVVQADLDLAWPSVGGVDLAWASSSLHEVADPHRVLTDLHAALNPGGLLVVVEMDGPPRFLPDDIGFGRPGLESRCHEAMARAGWNAHPDWRPYLERAGFQIAAEHRFGIEVTPAPPETGRYAHAYLSHIRRGLDGRLPADDLDALDRLLAQDDPGALLHRGDLTVRGTRTAWAARRP
ncbi:class I SAM-dependent methyltransferase [Sphaerisporangium rhizosphaerae]|uniref:Methyltransferase n=1 Tax=Sphaerisporangium rhizosphaerae TaxID=2269375 RepID=A0ABW2P437_9ACTN